MDIKKYVEGDIPYSYPEMDFWFMIHIGYVSIFKVGALPNPGRNDNFQGTFLRCDLLVSGRVYLYIYIYNVFQFCIRYILLMVQKSQTTKEPPFGCLSNP